MAVLYLKRWLTPRTFNLSAAMLTRLKRSSRSQRAILDRRFSTMLPALTTAGSLSGHQYSHSAPSVDIIIQPRHQPLRKLAIAFVVIGDILIVPRDIHRQRSGYIHANMAMKPVLKTIRPLLEQNIPRRPLMSTRIFGQSTCCMQ